MNPSKVRWASWMLAAVALMGLAAWAAGPAAAPSAGPLPTPFAEARYGKMSAKSPFGVATAVSSPTAAATPGFAADLYVDGVAHVGAVDYVAIKSRDPDKHDSLFLQVGDVSPDGLKVEGVEWSDQMGRSKVDVSKNGEKATLQFDQAQIVKGADAGGGMLPGQPGIPVPRQPMAGQQWPGAMPRPGVRPVGMPLPGGVDVRRRVRVIQSGQ